MLNQVPTIKQNLPIKNRQAGFRFGFELWEILTMFTVVLTIASSIMWFNNLVPAQSQNDFLGIEKEKHTIYSKYLALKNSFDKKNDLISTQKLASKCYNEVLYTELDSAKFDSSYDDIKNNLSYVDTAIENQKSKSSSLDEGNLLGLLQSYKNYLKNTSARLENKYLFQREILAIQKQAAKVCSSKSSEILDELKLLKERQEDLQEFNFEEFYPWRDNLNSFISTTQSLYSTPDLSLNIKDLSDKYSRIFSIQYSPLKYQKDITNENFSLENSFKKLEDWQKSFTSKKDNYKDKIIYIYI